MMGGAGPITNICLFALHVYVTTLENDFIDCICFYVTHVDSQMHQLCRFGLGVSTYLVLTLTYLV